MRAAVRAAATCGLAGVALAAVQVGWRAIVVTLAFTATAAASAAVVEWLAVVRGRSPEASAALAACGCLAVYLVAVANGCWCFVGPSEGLALLEELLRRGPGAQRFELGMGAGIVGLCLVGVHVLNALAERARGPARPVVSGAALQQPATVWLGAALMAVAQFVGLLAMLEARPTWVGPAMGLWAAGAVAAFAIGAVLVLGLHIVTVHLDALAWQLEGGRGARA